jgi:UDPglucose--hexose-1-phosphate uridylyltransferase
LLSSGSLTKLENLWEKRWHPLRAEWVVYSTHRNNRPWQGAEKLKPVPAPAYDPKCYLCPGNSRLTGIINPPYTDVFIFENDLPVVGRNAPAVASGDALYRKAPAFGVAKVICYDPRHNVTLSEVKLANVVRVFQAFQNETRSLSNMEGIKSVFIFENKGEAAGVSNPHPHCQLYATDFVFTLIGQQLELANQYEREHQRNLFGEIIAREIRDDLRIIARNDEAIAFIPFFARYAYEVMIFPAKRHASLATLSQKELSGLAAVFQEVVRKLDMNFNMSFPYVMSVMQAPVDGGDYSPFHTHVWLQPPFRQPGLSKYLAGPEIGGGNFMADTLPEVKAAELRSLRVENYNREE